MATATSKLLTQEQASAIAAAMAHLKNVCGVLDARILVDGGKHVLHVKEYMMGHVDVWKDAGAGGAVGCVEVYASQTAFMRAYEV